MVYIVNILFILDPTGQLKRYVLNRPVELAIEDSLGHRSRNVTNVKEQWTRI